MRSGRGIRSHRCGGQRRWAKSTLDWLDRSQLVTWERRDARSRVLVMASAWPYPDRPTYGPYIRDGVDELGKQGLACDVCFIRGYRTPLAYLAGAIAALLVPLAYPGKYLLLHCHGGEASLSARFFLGGPVLVSYQGTDLLGTQVGGNLRLRCKCWVRSQLLRRHAATMAATTTMSTEMEDLLTPRARSRNSILPQGVDRTRFRPRDRDQARAELGWPSDRTIVLFAGRAEASEKRLWLAEQAVELAASELPSLELRVAASVPPSQMPLHYAAADCFLHTSVSEGSPNVIKEALACNLPVVATPSGDVRELLAGVDACATPAPTPTSIASSLLEVLGLDRDSNGRERTEHLGIEVIAQKTIQAYRVLGVPVDHSQSAEAGESSMAST
jgi:glycosyltransferase involved in cell wall biosynthesis